MYLHCAVGFDRKLNISFSQRLFKEVFEIFHDDKQITSIELYTVIQVLMTLAYFQGQ